MPLIPAILNAHDPRWSALLQHTSHDFFHTAEYHRLSEANGEGAARMACVEDAGKLFIWPYLVREIPAAGASPDRPLLDITSVYGYAGPVCAGCAPGDPFQEEARNAVFGHWLASGIVSVFCRFHPLLANHELLGGSGPAPSHASSGPGVVLIGRTVAIDLSLSPEQTWRSYKRTVRQHLERARQFGLVVEHDPGWRRLEDFERIYNYTMERNGAAAYYHFSRSYFDGLRNALGEHGALVCTTLDGNVLSAAICIGYGGFGTVHLAGSGPEYYQLSPCGLLFHQTQLSAREHGCRYLHFGGGRGAREDDPLFRFKSGFSPSRFDCFAGKWILDPSRYAGLAASREKDAACSGLTLRQDFFPAYRAPLVAPESVGAGVSPDCREMETAGSPAQ